MKVLLVGCGAVGIALATALCASGTETDLVARGETARSIREGGVARDGLFGDAAAPASRLRVYESVQDAGAGYDYILNCSKTTGNAEIARGVAARRADLLAPGGVLVLCQNGIGNEHAFADALPQEQIYHGSFAIGFERVSRNKSRVTVFSKPITIGSIFAQPAQACARLAEAVDSGGIPCKVTDEIGKTLWAKLLYNCALNPLSAVLRVNYGGLAKSDAGKALVNDIIGEIFAVMRAAGFATFWPDAAAYRKEFWERIVPPTYEHRSSTLQDMERKIPTEIESLNGAVVRIGERCGVDAPCNRFVTRLIQAAEANY